MTKKLYPSILKPMRKIKLDEKNGLLYENGKIIKEIPDNIKKKFIEMIAHQKECYEQGYIIDRGIIKKIS